MYMKKFVDGGPAQQVTQFQPTFSPAQQGIGSLPYQAPNVPVMESSPTDYNQSPQYAPTQQYGAPATSYFAPAANPMTAGLGSYLQGLQYRPPVAPAPTTAPVYDSNNAVIYDPATQTYRANPNYIAPVITTAPFDGGDTGGDTGGDGGGDGPGGGSDGAGGGGDGGGDDGGGGDGEKAGGPIRAYARGGSTPQGIASLGRGKDTMLVHMTPGEVHGLQQLAMRHGGSLTINPQTGLPEAGILSSLLPMALGFALGPAGFQLMSSLQAAATVGGLATLVSGSLSKGLSAGFGAYGGAGLGESLSSMGAEQADKFVAPEVNASATMAGEKAYRDTLATFPTGATAQAAEAAPTQVAAKYDEWGRPWDGRTPTTYPVSSPPPTVSPTPAEFAEKARQNAIEAHIYTPEAGSPASQALARSPAGNALEGFKQLGTKEGLKTLGGKLGLSGVAGLAAPLVTSAMTPAATALPANKPTQYYNTSYNPPKYNPATGAYEPGSYGPGSYYTDPTQYAAQGGTVGYARGGPADFYPLTGDKVIMNAAPGGLGGSGEKSDYSRDIYGAEGGINNNKVGRGASSDDMGRGIHTNTPSGVEGLFAKTSATTLARYKTAKNAAMQAAAIKEARRRASAVDDYGAEETTSAAQGGLMGTYAAGGKLLRGPGDGMSDSIPAVIQGANPQRAALADGEFVMPADVVSHLGNGSTEAGSKRLYAMMDRVRKARTGNPKQGRQINPNRFMLA